jgi:hypothetical protein
MEMYLLEYQGKPIKDVENGMLHATPIYMIPLV